MADYQDISPSTIVAGTQEKQWSLSTIKFPDNRKRNPVAYVQDSEFCGLFSNGKAMSRQDFVNLIKKYNKA
jgi:hypothetical protein